MLQKDWKQLVEAKLAFDDAVLKFQETMFSEEWRKKNVFSYARDVPRSIFWCKLSTYLVCIGLLRSPRLGASTDLPY